MKPKALGTARSSVSVLPTSGAMWYWLTAAFTLSLQLCWSAVAQSQAGPAKPAVSMGGMALDRSIRSYVLLDQLEIEPGKSERPAVLELLSWIGGDYQRLYLRAQGEQSIRTGGGGELQADALYGRVLTPFWTGVAGVRLDTRERMGERAVQSRPDVSGLGAQGVTRGMLALGFEGIAPYWFDLEPTLFVSDRGDVSAEFESTLDLRFTQRLILQPRLELNAAVQAVPEFGVGAGLTDVEFGLRLRYEVHRKFAPYVGASWQRLTSGTAALAKAAGHEVGSATVVAGIRVWR